MRLAALLGLALAGSATPAPALEPSGPAFLEARVGFAQAWYGKDGSGDQPGPDLSVALGWRMTGWLEASLSLGWGRSTTIIRSQVPLDPTSPSSPLVLARRSETRDLVPMVVAWRAALPRDGLRPHLVAGGGLAYTRLQAAGAAGDEVLGGWGAIALAGAGVSWRLSAQLEAGAEAGAGPRSGPRGGRLRRSRPSRPAT